MVIRQREYEVCKHCGTKLKIVQDEMYGCDWCKKPIDDPYTKVYKENLRLQVLHRSEATEEFRLCSWDCVFKKLKTVKTDYFIALPFLSADVSPNIGIGAFWEAIDRIGLPLKRSKYGKTTNGKTIKRTRSKRPSGK